MPKIKDISSYKIVNSRGDWTLRTKATLDDGSVGIETVPDGASKGQHEVAYLPVDQALDRVNGKLKNLLAGKNPFDQKSIDALMVGADGTENKANLGGNS